MLIVPFISVFSSIMHQLQLIQREIWCQLDKIFMETVYIISKSLIQSTKLEQKLLFVNSWYHKNYIKTTSVFMKSRVTQLIYGQLIPVLLLGLSNLPPCLFKGWINGISVIKVFFKTQITLDHWSCLAIFC